MDIAAVLGAFDSQVRRSTRPDGTGAVVEATGHLVRRLALPGRGGSGVFWSGLAASDAPAVIAAQVSFFAARSEPFEWKLYDYDKPANLADLLVRADLVPGEPESMMVAQAADVVAALRSAPPPAAVRLVPVTDATGVAALIDVHERVFGHHDSALNESLLAQLAAAPQLTDMVIAVAGDEAVSAARLEYVAGSEFAGFWGGGTVRLWRRRGIYRALVSYRAALAVRRGYRYLTVDASAESRPILERIGFIRAAVTTPYAWSPPPQGSAA